MLHALCVLAALCAGAARNTIPKEQTPPEHPAFDGFEFLELLDVAEYPRAVAVEHEDAEEQGEELQRPSGISGRSMMSFLESLKGWTSHAFSFPKLLTQIQWKFHPSLNDKFYDAKAVGSGTFGVTFLAKTRTEELTGEAGQKVAVKLLKSSDNIWLSPYHYKHLPQIRPYIDLSRAECVDLQAIHRGEDADKEAAEHVVECLYDGISPQLRSLSDSFAPLYMVMNFVGSDDVDQWWAKQVKHGQGSGANTDILKALKNSVKGMLLGLRFLAESQTDTQWVHHDLKPQNMVVTDDTAETVLVDFGTVLSSKEPKKSSATTMLFAPPTVDHYGLWSEPVGWSPPIWSYDIYQAGATILGMAIGTQLADDGIELNVHAIPLYNFLIETSAQNAAAGFTDVKEVYRCAKNGGGDLLGNMWGCVGKHLVKVYGEEHQRHLQKILESSGDGKKQAIWTVVNCRSWGNEGQVMAKPTNMGTTKTQDFFWILVDDWINTGFDEVLVKMLSTDPAQRPKPSEVLEHAWFKQHTVAAGVPQTYTCPSMPASELEHIQGLLIVATVIAILSCIVVPFPGITYSLKLGGAWWKWLMAWAGFLVVMSPWILYFILDVLWLWIILTLPLGVAMMVLPFLPLSEEQAEKRVTISTALLGSAMGFSILMIPVASSTISMLLYLIEALKDHKAVTVDIAAARDFVTEINHRMVMLPILACLYSLAALITLRLKPGTGATSQAPDSARTPEVSFAKNATSTELTNMA